MNEPIKVFLSYSHKDDELREELSSHLSSLAHQKLIEPWHDRNIDAGSGWASEIDQNLARAEIILLLVSSDFINSRYCYSIEMKEALARHEANEVQVIPVIIRACDWQRSPLGKLQAIPRDNQAVASNRDKYARDQPWLQVVKEIGKVAQQIRDWRIAEFTVQQQAEARESFRSKAEELYRDGGFSYTAQELLRDAWTNLGLEEAEAIEIQQTLEANLARYSKVLMADLGDRSALSSAQRQELKMLQSTLGISDGKAASLEQVALSERALKLSPIAMVIDEPRPQDVMAVSQGNVHSPMTQAVTSFVEKLGDSFAGAFSDRTSLEMVKIPSGSFQMGSLPGQGNDDERPQHKVQVSEFWMGKYLVTQAQWKFVASLPPEKIELKAKPSQFTGDDRPVEMVTWNQALEFCQRLSKKTGNQYRLPSEAEWEYACRSGTTTAFCFGDTLTPEMANHSAVAGETTDVGIYLPNAFGLYDMHGNVLEWCQDTWHSNYNNAPEDGSAWFDNDSNVHLLRGGSWFDMPHYCRSAFRFLDTYRSYAVGFRVVCESARNP
jgi:formylglycine-generating enzyme required for sulfatase activity